MRRKRYYEVTYFQPHEPPKRDYGFWGFAGDLFMVFVSGGLWLIWIFVREMRGQR